MNLIMDIFEKKENSENEKIEKLIQKNSKLEEEKSKLEEKFEQDEQNNASLIDQLRE